jgi:3-oxochol-4-en-24-oyl-CoA dehydrogenase
MAIGLGEEQRALADAIADWAAGAGTTEVVKRSETEGVAAFADVLKQTAGLGLAGISLPEDVGGGGGSLVDASVAVEAAAAAMVPGALTPTVAAATVLCGTPGTQEVLRAVAEGSSNVGLGLREGGAVLGAGLASHVLVPHRGAWQLFEAADVRVGDGPTHDLSTRVGRVEVGKATPVAGADVDADRLHAVTLTLLAAESAGIARWALDTAVSYAKVREQFGHPIGSFQAIKHLCAAMLERTEAATAVAWDAARACDEDPVQGALAAAVAGVVGLDHAVSVAQDCVQVLGGIGFTWEHSAHLYLRRAMSNRLFAGGTDRWRLRLADLAARGVRRSVSIDLGEAGESVRADMRPLVEQVVAATGEDAQRGELVETGLLMPHWPTPYGRDAGPVVQLVVDEELAVAGVAKPSLGIGAWAAPTILAHGTEEQRERFVRPTLTGEIVWCQLFSEPGAGSDLASLRARAERTDGGWLLTGQKVWTSVAAEAHWGICLARTDPDAPRHRGISYFLVDMTSDGIDIRPLRELTGQAVFNEVFLDRVFVPDECVVGEINGGWPLARTTLANERVAMADRGFGQNVERALRLLVEDPAAGEAQRLRVGAAVAVSAAVKALSLRSVLRTVKGHGPGAESSVVKLLGTAERQDSAQLVVELLGDRVLLGDQDSADAMHEALLTRCLSIAGGTTQILRNVAAERILGLPR